MGTDPILERDRAVGTRCSGLLVSSVPLAGLAALAEESGISLYEWLTGHVRDLQASAQARLFGTPNAPDSFEEEEIDA